MRHTVLFLLLLLVGGCSPAVVKKDEPISCATGSISALGSSAQTGAVNTWIRSYQVACPDATIAYDTTGSGAGRRGFIAGTGDFAGTDSALSADEQSKANARCGTGAAIHLPMVVGPIALAYNLAGVGNLRLRPETLGGIFGGSLTHWNDPAIVADNPGVVLPSTAIVPIRRSDGSGTTDNFAAFLGSGFTFGPGGQAVAGSNGIATAVARTDGSIGYLEWSYARFHSLRTAAVANGAGEFTEVTAGAAGKTVAAATTANGSDLRLTIDRRAAIPGGYPIVLVTYEVVCAKKTSPLLRSFLAYTSSVPGQQAVARLGYAPLPESLRGRVQQVVGGLA